SVKGPEILDRAERHPLYSKSERLEALTDDLQAPLILRADGRAAYQLLSEGERGRGGAGQGAGSRRGGRKEKLADINRKRSDAASEHGEPTANSHVSGP